MMMMMMMMMIYKLNGSFLSRRHIIFVTPFIHCTHYYIKQISRIKSPSMVYMYTAQTLPLSSPPVN